MKCRRRPSTLTYFLRFSLCFGLEDVCSHPSVLTSKPIEIQTFLRFPELKMRYFSSNWYWKTLFPRSGIDMNRWINIAPWCPFLVIINASLNKKLTVQSSIQFISFHCQFWLLQHNRLNLTNQVQVTSYPKIKYILHKENKAYMLFY